MEVRPHSWWQKARKPLEVFGFIVVCMLVIALLVVIILAYVFNVNVPGLRGKTLWDWLQLLIIPAVLAVGGYLFNYTTTRAEQRTTQQQAENEQKAAERRAQTEREIASDNQREAALQAYIDKISELMLVLLGMMKSVLLLTWLHRPSQGIPPMCFVRHSCQH